MALLEQVTPGARVRGILVNDVVLVVSSRWFGSGAVEVTYKDSHEVAHSNIMMNKTHLPDGASEKIVRTVSESCRTLKFDGFGFEEE